MCKVKPADRIKEYPNESFEERLMMMMMNVVRAEVLFARAHLPTSQHSCRSHLSLSSRISIRAMEQQSEVQNVAQDVQCGNLIERWARKARHRQAARNATASEGAERARVRGAGLR